MLCVFFWEAEFSHFFKLKNMILRHTNDFCGKFFTLIRQISKYLNENRQIPQTGSNFQQVAKI
jgi:hypothetical protein